MHENKDGTLYAETDGQRVIRALIGMVLVTVDPQGRPEYLIISYGGTMRHAPVVRAVPWSTAGVQRLGENLVLGISKEKFFHAPHYSRLQDTTREEVPRIRAYFGESLLPTCSGEDEQAAKNS